MPIRPLFIRNKNKKYFPIDFYYLEDKVLILNYMLEERSITISDACTYVRNIHPRSISSQNSLSSPKHVRDAITRDTNRFKKIAANIGLNAWAVKDKIFEPWRSYTFLNSADINYINDCVRYLSTL